MSADSGILPAQIRKHLGTSVFARRVYYTVSVDSTNRMASELARGGEPHGTLVVTDFQQRGRGRHTRRWLSPAGENLLFSLILRPPGPVRSILPVTLAFASTLASTLSGVLRRTVGVKWPNDLVTEHGKLAGILSESAVRGNQTDFIIVGIGLNVNTPAEAFPRDLERTPVSCRSLGGRRLDRARLLGNVLTDLESAYERFSSDGFAGFVDGYNERLSIRGRRVLYGRGRQAGRVGGIAVDGGLIIAQDDGSDDVLYDVDYLDATD